MDPATLMAMLDDILCWLIKGIGEDDILITECSQNTCSSSILEAAIVGKSSGENTTTMGEVCEEILVIQFLIVITLSVAL